MKMKTYVLIDRSGSMITGWGEMTSAMSAFAKGIRKKLYAACFDHYPPDHSYIVMHDGKAESWDVTASMEAHSPRGGTPLYDAFGKLYDKIMSEKPAKAQVVIVTDGYENSSKEWTVENVKGAIKRLEKEGYDIIFLGAEFDLVTKQAQGLGLSASKTVNMKDKGNYAATMTAMATRNASYASGDTQGTDDLGQSIRSKADGW